MPDRAESFKLIHCRDYQDTCVVVCVRVLQSASTIIVLDWEYCKVIFHLSVFIGRAQSYRIHSP